METNFEVWEAKARQQYETLKELNSEFDALDPFLDMPVWFDDPKALSLKEAIKSFGELITSLDVGRT